MDIKTHAGINGALCGRCIELSENKASVEMLLTEDMTADSMGLVHGGFVFGMADYAAMLAVNHPNVVLGGSDVRFLKPCRLGEKLTAEAEVVESSGKKRIVNAVCLRGGEEVFKGTFTCFVLEHHVLEA